MRKVTGSRLENRQGSREGLEGLLFWSWVALLSWMPIPLGSNRPWAWAILEAGVFLLAALWLLSWRFGGVRVPESLRAARHFFVLLALWLVYEAVYLVPLPPALLEWLSPEAARMHALAAGLSQSAAGSWHPLSIDPHAAAVSWLKSLAYIGAYFLTLAVVASRDRARQFAYTLVLGALCLSVYGVLMNLGRVVQVWFGTTIPHDLQASATFANRNHFAGYLEMTLAIGIGLLIAGLRDARSRGWKQRVRRIIEWILSPGMRLRLVLCVLVIALVSTRSRMGNTAFFSSLIVAGLIGLVLSRHATRSTVVLLLSLIAIDLFIVGSWFGVEKLAQRIEQTTVERRAGPGGEESLEQRSEPAKYGLEMAADYPAFGTGPGSWYVAFPRYRSGDILPFYDEAHNDYVQFLAENGAIGMTLLASIVIWSFIVALRAQYTRRDPLMRGLAFAGIMGIIAILIHSSVDFNLRIPSNAMLFMVLLSFAWIAMYLDRRPSPSGDDGRNAHSPG